MAAGTEAARSAGAAANRQAPRSMVGLRSGPATAARRLGPFAAVVAALPRAAGIAVAVPAAAWVAASVAVVACPGPVVRSAPLAVAVAVVAGTAGACPPAVGTAGGVIDVKRAAEYAYTNFYNGKSSEVKKATKSVKKTVKK